MRKTEPRRPKIFILIILLGILSLSLFLCEMTIRYLGTYDLDGNFQATVLKKTFYIKPFHLPINFVRNELEKYHSQQSYLMYDSTLGWVPRPRSTSKNGLYQANDEGVRRGSIDANTRSGNTDLQVVLLGDSYTHGDEVPFEHTWGYYLEKKLAIAGIRADIINLGAPAYGMDQAYLRWKTFGAKLSPDIVIFGFQPENVKRNVNIFRMLYHKASGIVFSKPRFVRAGHHLELINSPTMSPDKILDIYANIDAWENRKHEYYYRPADYEDHIWLKSKLLAVIITIIEQSWAEKRERAFYAIEDDPSRLALTILNELRSDVEQRGASFLVAALIPQWNFNYVSEGRPFPYEGLLEAVKKQYDTIETSQQLFAHVKDGNLEDLFLGNHYSARANEIVAEVIAEAIEARKPTAQRSRYH